MLKWLKKEANLTTTENGAVTHRSTLSNCLDLFAAIGALRQADDEEIVRRFLLAFAEDRDIAVKILFFARDVRGGLGERRVFRVILRWLAGFAPQTVEKNLEHVAEYGRYDDLLTLLGTPCETAALTLIRKQLTEDQQAMAAGRSVSLLAKWLPSVNASSETAVRQAKVIARALGMNDARYRKLLAALRKQIGILENDLREKDYTFDYAKQPSKAMFKYRKAFLRNDGDRYKAFLSKVAAGEAVMHTGTLTPYDIIHPFFVRKTSDEERRAIDAAWKAQEDFTHGEHALVVIDGSASMYSGDPIPASVALSLGIYFAERNTGAFHNHFITFSEQPRLVELKGQTILEKVLYAHDFNEVANTNLQRVFALICETAVKHRIPQEEMPDRLYIISDMEFDLCTRDAGLTNFRYAKQLFAQNGYTLPEVVFWNVNSRSRQQPVTMNEQGVALVSGCSPRIFSMLTAGTLSPYGYMMNILNAARYAHIAA